MSNKEWFSSWFDTKYYHILYKNRDESEAKIFISNLIQKLELSKGTKVLDLACGKGRHSITMHEHGLDVLGVDLSPNSIKIANESAQDGLRFEVHDMRETINEKFDIVFNLFTSFGYFSDLEDNSRVMKSVNDMLNSDGLFVIDFMNSVRVINSLVAQENKTIEGIEFELTRKYDGVRITKDIRFSDEGCNYHHSESVQALGLDDFNELLTNNGFKIKKTYGNFELEPFDSKTSDRLIIVAQKIK
jgi:2-polyprenyl-3-methyl-5-hydroxy-6-metoxy-1,4-benzoquinol methylase